MCRYIHHRGRQGECPLYDTTQNSNSLTPGRDIPSLQQNRRGTWHGSAAMAIGIRVSPNSHRRQALHSRFITACVSIVGATPGFDLQLEQILENLAMLAQAFVGALIDYPAGLEHINQICAFQGPGPMGHQNRYAPLLVPHQIAQDLLFGLGVHIAGRFVKNQDRSLSRQRPGKGQPSPLPAGNVHAAPLRAQLGIDPLREPLHDPLLPDLVQSIPQNPAVPDSADLPLPFH